MDPHTNSLQNIKQAIHPSDLEPDSCLSTKLQQNYNKISLRESRSSKGHDQIRPREIIILEKLIQKTYFSDQGDHRKGKTEMIANTSPNPLKSYIYIYLIFRHKSSCPVIRFNAKFIFKGF